MIEALVTRNKLCIKIPGSRLKDKIFYMVSSGTQTEKSLSSDYWLKMYFSCFFNRCLNLACSSHLFSDVIIPV